MKIHKTFKSFLIPENLDINQIIADNPPGFKPFRKQHLLFILHLPYYIPAYNKEIRESLKENQGYIPFYSKKLREYGIRNYNNYLAYLVDVEILETDYHFKPGKARWYRFTEEYRTKPSVVRLGLSKYHKFRHYIDPLTRIKYSYLYKWFETGMLKVDYDTAFKYIYKLHDEESKKDPNEALMKLGIRFLQINDIKDGQHVFFQDMNVNRLYTNFTYLPKILRKFLSYDGLKLVFIDISNSTLFFASTLFDPDLLRKQVQKSFSFFSFFSFLPVGMYTQLYNYISLIRYYTTTYPYTDIPYSINTYKKTSIKGGVCPTTLAKRINMADIQSVIYFCEDAGSGQVYDRYKSAYEQATGVSISRSNAKDNVIKLVYSEVGQFKKEKDIFISLYPAIALFFSIIKKSGYKNLALLLMRIESQMVLDIVAKKITKQYPDVPIFTIHDCIATTVGNEHKVKKVFEDEIRNRVGIKPPLKIEYYN